MVIELKDNGKHTGLIAVEVTEDSISIELVFMFGLPSLLYKDRDDFGHAISLPNEKFEILGEITKDIISFDVGQNYYIHNKIGLIAEYAFRQLLKDNGIYWDNPLGEKPMYFDNAKDLPANDIKFCNDWLQYEKNRVKGKIIILKKI